MGTSKGYISPTTPNWTSTKRGISTFLSNPSIQNKESAVAKYAHAIADNSIALNRVSSIFGNFASFVNYSKANGLEQSLSDYNLSYINDLPPEEALIELIHAFHVGGTIDDDIASVCISRALEELNIISPDDLSNIDMNLLIKELVCQFAMQKFAQLFDKHIKEKCNDISVANRRMEDIQGYIYNKLINELTLEKIESINPLKLANEEIVNKVIKEAINILEYYYE